MGNFKINISNKEGKTYKLELESEALVGKELQDKIQGKEILPDLEGYELEITGASDKAGFPAMENVGGIGLKKVLLLLGKGMHKHPKGDKKKNPRLKKGLRLRKTVRGKIISPEIIQINTKIIKEGSKPLAEIFPEQNKLKEESKKAPPTSDNQQQKTTDFKIAELDKSSEPASEKKEISEQPEEQNKQETKQKEKGEQ